MTYEVGDFRRNTLPREKFVCVLNHDTYGSVRLYFNSWPSISMHDLWTAASRIKSTTFQKLCPPLVYSKIFGSTDDTTTLLCSDLPYLKALLISENYGEAFDPFFDWLTAASSIAIAKKKIEFGISDNCCQDIWFDVVGGQYRKYPNASIVMPMRATERSSGYDFFSPLDFALQPKESLLVFTDIKAAMSPDKCLLLMPRSSMGGKPGDIRIELRNTIGDIDSDYYNNAKNNGNIGFNLINTGDALWEIKAGDRIGQGIFLPYFITKDDLAGGTRTGGFGHTGK